MRPPRILVRTLMIVVASIAIDFAAIRAILTNALTFGVGLSALINTGLIGLALNISLLRMFRTGGRTRAFWVGFLVGGTVAMVSSAWAALTPTGSEG